MFTMEKTDQRTVDDYRTPLRWLVRVLRKSRDNWKEKYMTLQAEIKAMRTQVRDLRRSRENWRNKAETLEQELETRKKKTLSNRIRSLASPNLFTPKSFPRPRTGRASPSRAFPRPGRK